jgi:hypothetical protein
MARGGDMHKIMLAYWPNARKTTKVQMIGTKEDWRWFRTTNCRDKNATQMIATKED